jgi:hypothetical protein
MRKNVEIRILFSLLFLFLGCGGAAPPDRQMVAAEAAIRGAQEIGATSVPESSLYLRLAERQVDKAKILIGDGNNERAMMMLMRAQGDAELALALAKEKTAKGEAQEAENTVQELRNKMRTIGR